MLIVRFIQAPHTTPRFGRVRRGTQVLEVLTGDPLRGPAEPTGETLPYEPDAWQAAPIGIYAVFPQRRQLPLRVRLFIALLKETYGRTEYWLT